MTDNTFNGLLFVGLSAAVFAIALLLWSYDIDNLEHRVLQLEQQLEQVEVK